MLEGVRIVDFTFQAAGPYAMYLLAGLGADVLKIESSVRPDPTRGRENRPYQRSVFFDDVNVNKRSLALNMKAPGAIELVRRLVARSHALTDNFRPGVMAKWGLSYDDLHEEFPSLVVASLTAMGGSGPMKDLPGYAGVFASMGGISAMTTDPAGQPTEFRTSIDKRAGTMYALGILHGLITAKATGIAPRIDFSATEAVSTLMGAHLARYSLGAGASGNPARAGANRELHRARDGKWIAVAICSEPGRAAIDGLVAAGTQAGDSATDSLGRWVLDRDSDVAVEQLTDRGVAAAVVADARALANDPELNDREFFARVRGTNSGDQVLVAAPPWRIDGKRAKADAAPLFGQDTRAIMREVAELSDQEIDKLEDAGVLA